jgi:phenylalanyl-tRNA synthetase alpha chain
MLDAINQLRDEGLAALSAAAGSDAVDAWKNAYLGKSGKLAALMGGLKDVPKEQKPAVGAALNTLRQQFEQAFESAKASKAVAASPERVDMTEPGDLTTRAMGRRHIITRVIDDLLEVFGRMGFDVADGPELEDDEHNFVKLNIPPSHPARDPIDNFYVDDPKVAASPRMMRSQTSTVQIRVMEKAVAEGGGTLKHPIRVVAPGRVYRPDTVDATHSFMFHQLEGLFIDRDVTMVDLKSTLLHFARAYFGEDAEIRLRPSFFPFTEPSAELDMKIRLRDGEEPRWIELGGCGMVHPNVLRGCGIDPELWRGFAFGFGIERLVMGKHRIPDIRLLFQNDVRFLQQL